MIRIYFAFIPHKHIEWVYMVVKWQIEGTSVTYIMWLYNNTKTRRPSLLYTCRCCPVISCGAKYLSNGLLTRTSTQWKKTRLSKHFTRAKTASVEAPAHEWSTFSVIFHSFTVKGSSLHLPVVTVLDWRAVTATGRIVWFLKIFF